MNIILFEPGEVGLPLALSDPRAAHIVGVLQRREGEPFDAGIVDGPLGKGYVEEIGPDAVRFRFERVSDPAPADPIHILAALPRPQTARKILSEAAALGVASLRFFRSEKGEPGYGSSTLWKSEWRRHLVAGASQAFDTRLPEVLHHSGLGPAVEALPGGLTRIALDNYEAERRMTPPGAPPPLALAFGPERGWSAAERALLRAGGFTLEHLGLRVLRTETAVVAAVSIAKARG